MNHMEILKSIRLERLGKRLLVAAAVVLVAAAVLASLRVRDVHIEGSRQYSVDELEAVIFPDEWSRNPLYLILREKIKGNRKIPFVSRYTVSLTGINSVDIIVYEKDIIAYVEVMGSCIYFDRDGYVVESSSRVIEGVPLVTGLATREIFLNEVLPVENESVFQDVLNVTQYLRNAQITWQDEKCSLVSLVDTIELGANGGITCRIGEISVYLGDRENMEEKLLEMASILPNLAGREGTLYLDTYDENKENTSYVFK